MRYLFYLGQTAQNIIEVGKRLIQAKALVQHGHWLDWLQNNFQLTNFTAARFMQVATRFGDSNLLSISTLNSTQMIALLSLPDAAETEKFLAEKAAEGKRVDEMTIKQLREEIVEYKKTIENKDKDFQKDIDDLNEQIAELEQELKDRRIRRKHYD